MSKNLVTVKLKFKQLGDYDFSQAKEKLYRSPGAQNNEIACDIKNVVKQLNKAQDEIIEKYQTDIADKFAQRDEAGAIVRPDKQNPRVFEPDPEKEQERLAAEKAFGDNEFEINIRPLPLSHLGHIKFAPIELEKLEPLLQAEASA